MVGTDVHHHEPMKRAFGGLAARVIESLTMVTERFPAGSLPKVLALDVVAFGARCIIMVHVLQNRVPRSFSHDLWFLLSVRVGQFVYTGLPPA